MKSPAERIPITNTIIAKRSRDKKTGQKAEDMSEILNLVA
jgi:hypothetical protein